MEHCSHRHSDFYDLVPLLMSSIESHLSNMPKQVFFNPKNIFDTFTHSITLWLKCLWLDLDHLVQRRNVVC